MSIALDLTRLPACSRDGCTVDTFGPYHGPKCARARAVAELLDAWRLD